MGINIRNRYCIYHKPPLSKRRMKRTTLITEKNVWKAMGDINRFFKKPCLQFCGYINKRIGTTNIEFEDGTTYPVPLFDIEPSPNYLPYIGGECKPHSMYDKVVKDKSYRCLPKYLQNAPWIAIQSKFYVSCIPIGIGDRYKIMGDRLVVIHKYDKYINKTINSRYVEFIHDPGQKFNFENIASSVTSVILGDEYYLKDALSHITSDIDLRYTIESKYDDIAKEVDKFINNDVTEFIKNDMDNNPDTVLTKTIKSINGYNDIVFSINPKMLLDNGIGGNNFYQFSIPSVEYKSFSLINTIIRAYRGIIGPTNKQNEVEAYDGYDGYDHDYDYRWYIDTF